MIFSPARRGTNGGDKDTYNNVKEVPEVVINIVNHPIVEQMSLSSTAYDNDVNEFVKAGLTEISSDNIRPPRVAESPVAFECTVDDIITLGDSGGAGNLVISRVVKIHIDERYLDKDQKIDTPTMDLVGRMGGIWYTRASGPSLFQIPKPNRNLGIGVDALPNHVRDSKILSGNDLGRLGNLSQLPSSEVVASLKKELAESQSLNLQSIHKKAKSLIKEGQTEEALALLHTIDSSPN